MEKKIRILLAEDDTNLGSLLKQYLEMKGYETDLFPDGEKAYAGFMGNQYDFCILDVMMPIKDGFTLAGEIRTLNSEIPILFLTAKTLKDDIVQGFKAGADDYITKPFLMEELLLRMEAVMRRSKTYVDSGQQEYQIGKYQFHIIRQELEIDGKVVKLTTKETDLLKLLCNNANKVLDRNFALKSIWRDDNYFNARSMDVYITKLRKILKDDPEVEILNVHSKGFKLVAPNL